MDNQTKVIPGYAGSLWRFLASLNLTVVLLLCVAILSIIGTVIPQNSAGQAYVQHYGLFWYQVFALLDIVDMYHSWWFVGLLILLVINIIICSIDRLESTWKIIFNKRPRFDLAQYRQRKSRIDVHVQSSAARLKEPFQRFLRRRFRFCQMVSTDTGFAVTVERGRWTRLGVYAVHLSIVVLLLGGLIGARFGFEGFVKIPEGQSADTIVLNRTGLQTQLPFAIRCDDFDVRFYEGGQRPKEFRSSLAIIEEGREVLRKAIVVNSPLHYKGIGIYQSSYERLEPETAPAPPGTIAPSDEIAISFHSVESGIIYPRTSKLGQSIGIPEGLGVLTLERYDPETKFQSMNLGPALIGTLTNKQGETISITLPLKFPKFDTMRGGGVIISVTPTNMPPAQDRFATGLQVVYDPGVWVVYVGFILMIVGCAVAFFMSHQQMVVEVVEGKEGASVMVSGKANKNTVGFKYKLQRFSDQLAVLANQADKKDRRI